MRTTLGLVLLGYLLIAAPVATQSGHPGGGAWRVALTVGTSTFNGAAAGANESGDGQVFRPYRPTMVGVGLSYGRDRGRLALVAKYGQPGLGFRGVANQGTEEATGLLIVAENAFHLATVTASAGTRVVKLRGGPMVRSSIGVTLERWSAPGTPTRTLVGPEAGLGLEFALSGSLLATMEGELGFTAGSPFQAGDLPEGFRLRSTWRRTLQAGIALKL
jgi:hypothetical protein